MPASTLRDEYTLDDDPHKSTNCAGSTDPTSTDNAEGSPPAPWRALFFFTTQANLPILIAAILASLIAGATSPAQSFIVGKIFDRLTSFAAGALDKDEFMRQEVKYVLYLVVLAAIAWVSSAVDLALWIAFGELQAKSARDRLFYGLLRKEIQWYDLRRNGISALLPRLQARIRELQLSTSQPLGVLGSAVSSAVLSLIQAFVLSWKLTLVTISTVPVIIGVVAWVGGRMQRAFECQGQRLSDAQKCASSAFGGIETVKCFNAQHLEQRKYISAIREAARYYYCAASANAVQMALVVFLASSMFVQGFHYGSVLIARGEKSTADVITTLLSALFAFQAINGILPQLIVLERGRIAGAALRAMMAEISSQQKSLPPPPPPSLRIDFRHGHCRGDIEISDLTFAYPSNPQQPAVQNLSLFIPGGRMTYLIGKSGSGKSTIGQLLMRFYSSYHGRISLDGADINAIDVQWLRSNITLVEQNSLLFNDTIFCNVAFGKHHHNGTATKDEVAEAVEFALLQQTINDMPLGLETLVGYKGSTLSGGQRQRMALARARLRDTPILILDECTSALDQISRSLITEAIRFWRRGKTTIVITHNVEQILPEDYVYVLEQGRVVQSGYMVKLEREGNMSFQGVVPTEAKTIQASNTKALGFDAEIKRLSQVSYDPLHTHLGKTENKRATLLLRVFQDRAPLPGMASYRAGVVSPWLQSTTFSPLGTDGTLGRSDALVDQSEYFRKADHGGITKRKRMTQELTGLVDRAGRLAADARITSRNSQRRSTRSNAWEGQPPGARRDSRRSKLADTTTDEEYDTMAIFSRSLHRIYATLWPNITIKGKLIFLLACFASTVHAVSSPVFSFVLAKLLRIYSIPGGDSKKSLMYSMIILGVAFVDAISTYVYHFSFEYVGQRWVDSIRSEAVKRILDQPREFFDAEENTVSRLTGCLDRNAEEMRNLLGRFLNLFWIAAVMSFVSVVWAMVVQWKMTAIALAAAPYILGVTKAYAMVSERWEKLCNDSAEDSATIFTEVFTNIKTVRALTLEQHFISKYVKATNRSLAVGFRRAFLVGFFYGLSDSAGNFSIAMVFFVGSRLAASGARVDLIVQVLAVLIFAIANLEGILAYIPQVSSSKDTASRLLRLAHLPEDSHEHSGEVRIVAAGDVVFNQLRFAYPSRPEQAVLKNFDLFIRPGVCTAIVGGSGSGKSTIANLLLKLYATTGGPQYGHNGASDLMLAGRDVKRIDTESLRSVVVPVSQTTMLFAATVYDNIAYGLSLESSFNTYSAIAAAAQQAGIHDFINSLPQGYSTPIGEGGIGLSGGQAQRIAIARALVRKPSVLILDEATSALDHESANVVRRTIAKLVHERNKMKPMTIIIITHSREMMEIAENVVVLDRGSVVEEGAFEDLVRRNGALTNLLSGGEWIG